MVRSRTLWSLVLLSAVCSPATAGGGPHNVVVVANVRSADSVAVANAYRDARGIPDRNICLIDLPVESSRPQNTIPFELYEKAVLDPLGKFLREHPGRERLHFMVLCPDLPLRVNCGERIKTRSMASLLTMPGAEKALQRPKNPYMDRREAFERIARDAAGDGRMFLVTCLRGYELRDAMDLVRRSVEADGSAPKGTFHFVLSPHVRQFDTTVKWLESRGMAARLSDNGKPVRGADDVAGYFSGGSYSGLGWSDISSNTYLPGCLVDMLESYGAMWNNWRTFSYHMQVPVAWMIRAGATGVHGATDEPFADSFPTSGHTETLLSNYLAGCNLAEAYWSAIPYLGWQNAVFGDPLCAPYAVRPKVTCRAVDASRDAPPRVEFAIEMPQGATLAEVRCLLDGRPVATFARSDLSSGQAGCYSGTLDVGQLSPVDGWHRVRVVAVDASPAAVQGWAVTDVPCGQSGRLTLALSGTGQGPIASGSTVELTATMTPGDPAAVIDLFAGDRSLGRFAAGPLKLDTSTLGPGRPTLQARAAGATGKAIAVSNFVCLDLADPLHVVDHWPLGDVGSRPLFQLVYDRPPQLGETALKSAARFVQGARAVAADVQLSGRTLTVEAQSPLKPAVPCRLEVRLPAAAGLSRDVAIDFTPLDDSRLLAGMSGELPYRNTVTGLSGAAATIVWPVLKRPAAVVLGPVDLFSPTQPALASLTACTVSGQIDIAATARPAGKGDAGAGLGVHYSDNRNHCFVRIRDDDVAVIQVLGGKETTLKTWPAPGPTVGRIDMEVTVQGPQLTVSLGGKSLGSVMLDRTLPPGLPMIDLRAAQGVKALKVTVRRP
ncbi:MAG: TIGR03790 family protein [Planctomycetes bacterium]|nr:TIGR03790 family protein [Planctomycetota bacterium]